MACSSLRFQAPALRCRSDRRGGDPARHVLRDAGIGGATRDANAPPRARKAWGRPGRPTRSCAMRACILPWWSSIAGRGHDRLIDEYQECLWLPEHDGQNIAGSYRAVLPVLWRDPGQRVKHDPVAGTRSQIFVHHDPKRRRQGDRIEHAHQRRIAPGACRLLTGAEGGPLIRASIPA